MVVEEKIELNKIQVSDSILDAQSFHRETTELETVVGEIRSWALWGSNWDGEGASTPSNISINQAVNFLRSISINCEAPEPMLLPSGNVASYWRRENFYFEVEFHGQAGVSYFAEAAGSRHKGMVEFDGKKISPILEAILDS